MALVWLTSSSCGCKPDPNGTRRKHTGEHQPEEEKDPGTSGYYAEADEYERLRGTNLGSPMVAEELNVNHQ